MQLFHLLLVLTVSVFVIKIISYSVQNFQFLFRYRFHKMAIHLIFWQENGWRRTTPSTTWNFGPNWPIASQTQISNRYPLVAPQP